MYSPATVSNEIFSIMPRKFSGRPEKSLELQVRILQIVIIEFFSRDKKDFYEIDLFSGNRFLQAVFLLLYKIIFFATTDSQPIFSSHYKR